MHNLTEASEDDEISISFIYDRSFTVSSAYRLAVVYRVEEPRAADLVAPGQTGD